MTDIQKRAHVLKHSHGRCVVGDFVKFYMKALFVLVIELFYFLSSTNKYPFTLYIMVQDFMTNIYHQMKKQILMMTGLLFSKTKGYKDIQFKISKDLFKSILCSKK